MEKELQILKAITVGIQGRVYDRVYYIVDGKQRSRAYTRPGDPKTGAQRACQGRMAALVKRWHALNSDQKEYWNAVAKQSGRKRTTGFNMFIRDGLLKARSVANREPAVEGGREIRRFVRIVRPHGGYMIPVKSQAAVVRATTPRVRGAPGGTVCYNDEIAALFDLFGASSIVKPVICAPDTG